MNSIMTHTLHQEFANTTQAYFNINHNSITIINDISHSDHPYNRQEQHKQPQGTNFNKSRMKNKQQPRCAIMCITERGGEGAEGSLKSRYGGGRSTKMATHMNDNDSPFRCNFDMCVYYNNTEWTWELLVWLL